MKSLRPQTTLNTETMSSRALAFYLYTAVIALGPIGCAIYFLLQVSTQYLIKNKLYALQDMVTLKLLTATFLDGLICGALGLSLHLAKDSGEYCKLYGMTSCFAFLGGGKAMMYLIFIRRARIANGHDLLSNKQRILFDVVAPIYVIIYWLFYVVGSALVFPGLSVDPLKNGEYRSFCVWQNHLKS